MEEVPGAGLSLPPSLPSAAPWSGLRGSGAWARTRGEPAVSVSVCTDTLHIREAKLLAGGLS